MSLLCLAHHAVRLWRSPRRWPGRATNPVRIRWKSHDSFPFSWGRWPSFDKTEPLFASTKRCLSSTLGLQEVNMIIFELYSWVHSRRVVLEISFRACGRLFVIAHALIHTNMHKKNLTWQCKRYTSTLLTLAHGPQMAACVLVKAPCDSTKGRSP